MGPNQFQAMQYMASMYPYFAQQQAMAQQFPYMGMPGMMPPFPGGFPGMAGFPGMPPMPGMMPGFPGMPGMMPGAFPGMPPGFPGMMGAGPEYAAYYQKMMEAQAAAMAAMGSAAGAQAAGRDGGNDSGNEFESARRPYPRDGGMMMREGSPMQRRDMNSEQHQRGSGMRDSPIQREGGRGGDGMMGGSLRKNNRREDEKRVDPVLEEFKNNKTKRFDLSVSN